MKIIVTIARIITGVLFIFSGLVKAIDPRGLAYKMKEFFEAFSTDGYLPKLMHSLEGQALAFSITIITMEVIVGLALLLGWKRKIITWLLLLLMLLFTFLTSYVLFSGKIRACGCFGDCIPITPIQTFTKDIILLLFAILLLVKRKYILPLNKPLILLTVMILGTAATIMLQLYVLKHLPLFDCLPFKKGNNIVELQKLPAGAIQPQYDFTFVYEKAGVKKDFTAATLPDSSWTFIERKQVLVKEGKNNVPLINDFTLNDADGNNLTDSVLNNKDPYYLLYLEHPSTNTNEWISDFKMLINKNTGIAKIFVVTSQRAAIQELLSNNGIKADGIFTSDATAIKTAARANPTLYRMKGPVIEEKWGWADFDF